LVAFRDGDLFRLRRSPVCRGRGGGGVGKFGGYVLLFCATGWRLHSCAVQSLQTLRRLEQAVALLESLILHGTDVLPNESDILARLAELQHAITTERIRAELDS
jgi:hypothetical protein